MGCKKKEGANPLTTSSECTEEQLLVVMTTTKAKTTTTATARSKSTNTIVRTVVTTIVTNLNKETKRTRTRTTRTRENRICQQWSPISVQRGPPTNTTDCHSYETMIVPWCSPCQLISLTTNSNDGCSCRHNPRAMSSRRITPLFPLPPTKRASTLARGTGNRVRWDAGSVVVWFRHGLSARCPATMTRLKG